MKYILRLLIFCLLASFSGFSQGFELVKNYPTDPLFKAIEYTTNGEMYVHHDYRGTYSGEISSVCAALPVNSFISKLDKNRNCIWSLQTNAYFNIN